MFFFKKQEKFDFDKVYSSIKNKIGNNISDEKKNELSEIISNHKYINSSFANLNLSDEEVIYCLDKKIEVSKPDNEWLEIKIINLGALNGFIEWLKQLIILPENSVIYLMPFHPRDFEISYLVKSKEVDEKLKDNNFELSAKEQIQLFVNLAHKCGHPVIYDFLLKTSRYSKTVIENPYLARWIDTKYAEEQGLKILEDTAKELEKEFDKDDIEIIKNIYKQESKGCLSEEYEKLLKVFENKIFEKKLELSKEIYKNENQTKLQKRVLKKTAEELIQEGLWTVPCGADEEFGLPVFDYMNKEENYPVFKHFNKDKNDISQHVKDDFQTPANFKNIETNEINKDVLKYFIKLGNEYSSNYGFDGFVINYTPCEEIYNDKIPSEFLQKLSAEFKKKNIKLFANGNFNNFKENQKSGFDIIWNKPENLSPQNFIKQYEKLSNYNTEDLQSKNLSAIKIYNDKFAEAEDIDIYPSQLGFDGAIFKWFCLHFLPTGKNAKLPVLYLDGDESFTEKGFTETLFKYSKLQRNNNIDFYNKFNAIREFAFNSKIIKDGEATIINEDEDGFVCWMISKEPLKEMFLIVANYKPKNEKIILQNDNKKIDSCKENDAVVNKMITLPGECKIACEYVYNGKEFIEKDYKNKSDLLEIEVLNPSDFRIFLLRK